MGHAESGTTAPTWLLVSAQRADHVGGVSSLAVRVDVHLEGPAGGRGARAQAVGEVQAPGPVGRGPAGGRHQSAGRRQWGIRGSRGRGTGGPH